MLRSEIMHPDSEIVQRDWATIDFGRVNHWCLVGSEGNVLTACGIAFGVQRIGGYVPMLPDCPNCAKMLFAERRNSRG